MRKALLATSLVALAIPSTAHASEVYIGVSSGFNFVSDSSNEGAFDATVPATEDWPSIPSGTSLGWDTDFETGMMLSGHIGMKYDSGLRAELEVGYSKADVSSHSNLAAGGAIIDGVDVAVLTRGAPNVTNPTVGEVIADGQGELSTFGAFLNGYYDFNAGSGFVPFLGAGIGLQSVDVDFMPSGVPVAADSDDVFAWQLMAGASVELSNSVDVYGQLTYRQSFERANVALDLLPATLGVEADAAFAAIGIRFDF